MRLETLYLLKTWLGHGTYGVNAQIAGVPRIGTDPLPAGFSLIAEAGHNGFAARRQRPDRAADLPALLLGLGRSARLDAHSSVGKRDGLVEVTLSYFAVEADSEVGVQEAEYRCRALERSVDDWFVQRDPNDADRLTGNVSVWYLEQPIQVLEPFAPISDSLIGGEMALTLKVRDLAP